MVEDILQLFLLFFRKPQQIRAAVIADVKAAQQVGGFGCVPLKKGRTNPEDDPFIWLDDRFKDWLVQFQRAD